MPFGGVFDIANKQKRADELDQQAADPAIWVDPIRAQSVMRELSGLKQAVGDFRALEQRAQDAQLLIELAEEAEDEDTAREVGAEIVTLQSQVAQIERELMFSGKHDHSDAIITIQPGAGGVDAQDWAEMLYRMYLRWAEANGFKVSEMDYSPAETAGIKNATLSIRGDKVYGWLRSEKGTHRLVRMSPFNAGNSRETSFARVEVYPDLQDDEIDIELNPADLEIETHRSRGAGGQNVQKNESAIRIRHLPTGIIVTCQDQRSQTQNRERALHILKVRLQELEEQKRDAELRQLKGDVVDANFGSQIRSYVQHPYQLVKDLRSDYETGNIAAVLDGDLTGFMEAFLKMGQ